MLGIRRTRRKWLVKVPPRSEHQEAQEEDLPCPWCHSPTHVTDKRCPACGHKFG